MPAIMCGSMVSIVRSFGLGAGVHQGSMLSLLLFILVLEAFSCEFHIGVQWELLYTYDLMLIADTQEECISKLKARKAGMENKGLHVNMKKTKFLVLKKSDKYPCAVCCGVVSNNSIQGLQCMLWVHKNLNGITKRLVANPNIDLSQIVRHCPSMAELWLKLMSMAPCLIWRPL